MKTLHWRHTDWNARRFIFSIGQEIIGQLSFNSPWNFNATYTDHKTNLLFIQKGYWNKDTTITRNGVDTYSWQGSRADAASRRRAAVESGVKRKDIGTVEVEIPTTKTGLLDWLNCNFTGALSSATEGE